MRKILWSALLPAALVFSSASFAQQPYPPAAPPYGQPAPPYGQQAPPYYGQQPSFSPAQLEDLVSRIALYADPLLAEVLTASTYPDQVQQAAWWEHEHRYLYGDALAQAIEADRLPFDPSVLGLIPFPMVLDMMAGDAGWTQQLGAAVLAARPDVMDAVQRLRQRALDAGYLRDTPQQRVVVRGPGCIEIVPAQPGYYYVPSYNPVVVFGARGRGVYAGVGITFGPRIFISTAFVPYGWASPGLDWRAHTVIIDHHPWERGWANRERYQHPYERQPVHPAPPPVERHERDIRRREPAEHERQEHH